MNFREDASQNKLGVL